MRGPSVAASSPNSRSVPPLSGETQPTMRIVDDFPAPLGPRNPKASPWRTWKSMPSTAVKAPKRFVRPAASTSTPLRSDTPGRVGGGAAGTLPEWPVCACSPRPARPRAPGGTWSTGPRWPTSWPAPSAATAAGFAAVLSTARIWVNGEPADPATAVGDTDEVAVLPPVSGG